MAPPSTEFDEPPPYAGHSSAFSLPLYEDATSLDTWADSYCLPPYQSRTGQRYHPYMRILPVHRGYIPHQERSFEEFYRSLQASTDRRAAPTVDEASTAAAPRVPTQPVEASPNGQMVAPPDAPLPPLAPDPGPNPDPEERRQWLINRLFLLPEILRIVRVGLGAAMRAAEARF